MTWLMCYLAAWGLFGVAVARVAHPPVVSMLNGGVALLIVGCLLFDYSVRRRGRW